MPFSCNTSLADTYTDTQLTTIYSGEQNAIMPNGLLGYIPSPHYDSQNLLDAASINAVIKALKPVIEVSLTQHDIAYVTTHNANIKKLLDEISAEYCYYYSRYLTSLNKVFSNVRDGYQNPADNTIRGKITKYLGYTQTINTKLNNLTHLVDAVSKSILESSNAVNDDVIKMNVRIKKQQEDLNRQNKIITSSEADIKIRKEMVKYSEEKARNSDNLLKLYGFLNIVVVGLLVYVYKAASE